MEFEHSSALLVLLDAYAFPYEDILFIGRRSVKTGAVCLFSLPYFLFRIIFPSVGAEIDFPWGSFFQTSCCGGCGK